MTNQARAALRLKRPPKPRNMVTWQLQQTLDFDPSSRKAYSGLGYCVLGRIIEVMSGQTYEQYMPEPLLSPVGMHATRLGKTRSEDRGSDEVRYYVQKQTRVPAV